jgi:hypothetical protein
MNKIFFLLIVIFTCSTTIFGQTTDSLKSKTKHEASFDFGAFYTPVLSKNLYGGNIDFKYYPYKKIATGLCFSMTEKKIGDTFSYSIGQPLLDYYEIGWINQYDVVQKDKIRIGINLNNGIAISRLGDNSEKEKYWTKYGYRYGAKEVTTNYFYLLQPGLDISFRLFSKNHYPDFYLTTKAKYRFVFGDSKYGQLSDFSNYYFGLGLSIIGFTDEEPKQNTK